MGGFSNHIRESLLRCARRNVSANIFLCPSDHATFLVLAWQALVRDLWSTPVVRYSLSHHLCALFDVCSQALDCASALDRVYRFQPLCLLMAARQTSIITTTAPPVPALAANVETEPAVFATPDVVCPTRVKRHPPVITVLLALVTRVSAATIAPHKVLAVIIASLLILLAIACLSKTFVPRSLGFSFVPHRTTLNCPSRNACWCRKECVCRCLTRPQPTR